MGSLQLLVNYSGKDGFKLAVDCELPTSGITALYGPSGSGKTTLLNCIAGLLHGDESSLIQFSGDIWQSDTQFTPPWQRQVGFVFQDARLFPHLTVERNLGFAMNRRAFRSKQISFDEVIDWLQLAALLNRLPETLSAGQVQRVAIGRALLSGPRLLLMDEPLANLDHAARQECLYYLRRLRTHLELPMLYVSHDMEEVSQIADHLILIENGRVVSQGTLLDLCSRLDSRLSHEEQAAAIVVGTIKHHDTHFGLTEVDVAGSILLVNALDETIGRQRRLRIPARDVSICKTRPNDSSILNIVPVVLSEIEQTDGSRVMLRLALGEQFLLARITQKSAETLQLEIGDELFAQIKSAALLTEAIK